ncbi:hypothetical protein [Burkholderia plantarii]|uniref:hypothetical protein n=1 Tax=Burkholderia plantarii TaxID=41899 RepID=UPI0018DC5015|nr:hypothetical protein [Burkholderia plantarii]MBI0331152.1 hypothetical protein [Burkholderia plantarii]
MLLTHRPPRAYYRKAALFFAGMSLAAAAYAALPLRVGTYGDTRIAECGNVPNAGIVTYDGRGLGGAHSSHCVSTILKRTGNEYDLRTTCSALGDGTPVKPETFKEKIRILSPVRFSRQLSQGAETYRFCPNFK